MMDSAGGAKKHSRADLLLIAAWEQRLKTC